jgi:hypothetical protein
MPASHPNPLHRRFSMRRLRLERLEDRTLLSGSPLVYPNPEELVPPQSQDQFTSTATGDFANNRKMDFAVVSYEGDLDVYLGNGDGTFQQPVAYSVGGESPRSMVAGDFTNNGILDLAIAASSTLTILMGNGDGTFQAPVNYTLPISLSNLAVGEFNGDGNLDLVGTDNLAGTVAVLLGNGNGTFQSPIQSPAVTNAEGLTVGDFTGNGQEDVALASSPLEVLLGNGDGTFQTPIVVAPGSSASAIASGDLSGNGNVDLVTAGYNDPGIIQIWEGDGTGHFQAGSTYTVGVFLDSVAVADLTGNGKLDIIAANADVNGVSVLLNQGNGTFGNPTTYVTATPGTVQAADFVTGGEPDILSTGAQFAVLMNNGDGTFHDAVESLAETNPNASPQDIAEGDLNGDGAPDIVVSDGAGNGVDVLLNNGHGGFDAPVFYSTGANSDPQGVALADLTGDGNLDLIVADAGTSSISVFLGKGDGTFEPPVTYPSAGDYTDAVAVGDVNGDGKLDVVAFDALSDDVSVFLGNGDGTLNKPVAYTADMPGIDAFSNDILLADFSGDGKLDVAVSDPTGGVAILPGNGDGTFGTPVQIPFNVPEGAYVWGIAAADLTGNGKTDLVATSQSTFSVFVFLNQGDYKFQASSIGLPALGDALFYARNVAIGDFNGDGIPDLVVGSEGSQVYVLIGNGNGTFQTPVAFDAGPAPANLAIADFDGDGIDEIAASDIVMDSDTVTVLDSGGAAAADSATVTKAPDAFTPFNSAVQSVTLNATVTSGGQGVDEGTVTFSVFQGATQVGTSVTSVTLEDGDASASFTVPAGQPAGAYTLIAVYKAGSGYLSSADDIHTFTIGPTTTTTAANESVPYSTASATVALSAEVENGGVGVSQGTVTFSVYEGVTQIGASVTSGTVNDGVASASFTVPAGLPAGVYTIRAAYDPEPGETGSTDILHTLTVSPATTTTSATSASTDFDTLSQTIALSATVTSPAGSVDEGTVTFSVFQGNTQLGTSVTSGTLSAGTASANFALPAGQPPGTYTIEAVYDPGADYQGSSDSIQSLTIAKGTTSTAASNASAAFSNAEQSMTLNATVTSDGAPVSQGTVTLTVFTSAGVQIGQPTTSGTVSGGSASAVFVLPAGQAPGSYTIDAVYNPGNDYEESSDSTHVLSVGLAATSTSTTDAVATFNTASQTVTLSATVTSGGTGVDEGTVTFTVFTAGDVQVGQPTTSSNVAAGLASAIFTSPAGQSVGTYTIQTVYNPGLDYQTSSDSTHTLTLAAANTSTDASDVSATYDTLSQSVTLAAEVTSGGAGVNEGSVTFALYSANHEEEGASTTIATLVGGKASVSYSLPAGLPVGTYTILTSYTPGPEYLASTDSTHTLTVAPAATTTDAANATADFSNDVQTISLSAAVTSGVAAVGEGTVTFTLLTAAGVQVGASVASGPVESGTASVNYSLPAGTAPGIYTIQAQYADSVPGNYAGSIDHTRSLVVGLATTITATNLSTMFDTAAQNITLQAAVSSTTGTVNEGAVTFSLFDSHDNQVGGQLTSATVTGGSASVTFALPAGTPAGGYVIQAQYDDPEPGLLLPAIDTSHTLTVQPATTSISTQNIVTGFNSSGASVPLSATIASPAGAVNEGTVTFGVFNGSNLIGEAVTSSDVSGGMGTASFNLPAGTPPGSYTLRAEFDDAGGNFVTSNNSTDSAVLTITPAQTTTTVSPVVVPISAASQSVTLHASIQSAGGTVGGGSVSFTVMQGASPLGSAVSSGAVVGGMATSTYTLPAGTPAGSYTIEATYSDEGGYLASPPATNSFIVDAGPRLDPIDSTNSVTLSAGQFPYSTTLDATSTDGSPLTFNVMAIGDSLLFDVESQYQFSGVGYFTAGVPAYVLHSNLSGPGVGGYYLLSPAGNLYAYDGSGNYNNTRTGTPLVSLSGGVYTDTTLLLNALPPANYVALQATQSQYEFTGLGYYTADGVPAYVLKSSSTGPGAGRYYLLSPAGNVYPYDGSGNYNNTLTGMPIATFGADLYSYPSELIDSQAPPSLYSQLYVAESQLDLHQSGGSYYINYLGSEAEWLYSPILNQYGEHWYTLILSGGNTVLHAWEGYQDSSVGAVVATFDSPTVYENPTLLTNATFLPDPPATTATVSPSGTLTINLPSAGFLGTFHVVVTANDGTLTSSQTVTVTCIDTAPTLSVTQNSATVAAGTTLSVPVGSFPLSDTTTASAADSQDVTTTATVSSYSQLFSLEQQYRFQRLGYFHAGGTAYVFSAAGDNTFGNAYYLLSTTGGLYAYDGSGNYATSFARTPIATLSAEVYSDPTLLTNAQPPIDYSQYYALQQQYEFQGLGYFTAGATAYVFQSSQSGPGVDGYYLLTANGNLYAYDGSGNYATSIANSANLVASLDPGVFVHPSLLLDAQAAPGLYPQLQQTEQQLDLQELPGGFYVGLMGNAAKWLYSPVANSYGQHYYTLVLSAATDQALLFAWNGGSNSVPTGATPVATLDPSVYYNPSLLVDATAPVAATGVMAGVTPTGVSSSPESGTLSMTAPTSFVGTFQVTVTTTDGALSTSETFQIASTDTAPVPTAITSPQTVSASGSPLVLNLTSTPSGTVTYTATAASAAYALQQQYQFTGVGLFTVGGVTAYVLHSNVAGGVDGYYLLTSTGAVYAYDGSGSYASTIADSYNLVAQLSLSVYNTPALLTQATEPTLPADLLTVTNSASPATLTINATGVTPGSQLVVFVTASDSAENTRYSFLVNVTM